MGSIVITRLSHKNTCKEVCSFDMKYVIDDKFGLNGKYSAIVEPENYSSTKTFTAPEFGMLTMMMPLISIIDVVLLTAKSRISL
ncbi:MAG: hypothetical protein ACRBB2_01170 [Nitrosopumilus sp.]